MNSVLSGIILALSFTILLAGDLELGKSAPDFRLKDANGKEFSLTDFKGKYVVLEWVNFGCPFVQKHYNSKNMQDLQKTYTKKGVIWLSVCSSAEGKQGYYSNDEVRKHLEEKDASPTAYLIDEAGTVGKMYDAKTTPHMYIINPEGILVYAGAIDDIRSTNPDDIGKAHNYVSKTLEALMQGEKVKPYSTESYGCSVKYK